MCMNCHFLKENQDTIRPWDHEVTPMPAQWTPKNHFSPSLPIQGLCSFRSLLESRTLSLLKEVGSKHWTSFLWVKFESMSIIYTHWEIILKKMFYHVIHVYIYTRRWKIFPAVCPFPSSPGQCPCPSCTLRASWTFPSEHPSWYEIICWHNYMSSVSASPDCKHHKAVAESVLLRVTSPGSGAMLGMKQAPRYCWRSKGCYPWHHLVLRKCCHKL